MKLKRILVLLTAAALILTLMLTLLTSCGTSTGSSPSASETVTITDHDGNVVDVPKNPQRIVICDIYPLPSVLAVFFDSADKIAGMAGPSMSAAKNSLLSELYPEILNAQTGFIDGTAINVEELMKLSPDVVFYSSGNSDIGGQLRSAGVPAVAISASKWDYDAVVTLNNWISLLEQMFPDSGKAGKVASYSADMQKLIGERVSGIPDGEREKVFFLFKYDETMISTSGKRFFGQWWADATGGVNVGSELDKDNSAAVSMEQIYKWNPSVIFITNFNTAQPDDLCNNTIGSNDWSGIDAVKNGRVYKTPLGMYRSYTPGVDTPVTLLWIAKASYPELFADIDITQKTKEYYKDVFGIDLTDSQADSIFAPPSDAAAYK